MGLIQPSPTRRFSRSYRAVSFFFARTPRFDGIVLRILMQRIVGSADCRLVRKRCSFTAPTYTTSSKTMCGIASSRDDASRKPDEGRELIPSCVGFCHLHERLDRDRERVVRDSRPILSMLLPRAALRARSAHGCRSPAATTSSNDTVVYVHPSIWVEPHPTLRCTPPCIMVAAAERLGLGNYHRISAVHDDAGDLLDQDDRRSRHSHVHRRDHDTAHPARHDFGRQLLELQRHGRERPLDSIDNPEQLDDHLPRDQRAPPAVRNHELVPAGHLSAARGENNPILRRGRTRPASRRARRQHRARRRRRRYHTSPELPPYTLSTITTYVPKLTTTQIDGKPEPVIPCVA